MGNQINLNILTDCMGSIEKSPKAIAYWLERLWRCQTEDRARKVYQEVLDVARLHGEPFPSPDLFKVAAMHHSSEEVFIRSSGNLAERLEVIEYGTKHFGRPELGGNTAYVTLKLPQRLQPKEK